MICARGTCARCARFSVGGAPSRTSCAYEVVTRRRRRISLSIVCAFVTIAATVIAAMRFATDLIVLLGLVVAGLAGLFGAAVILPRAPDPGVDVVAREAGDRPASTLGAVHRRTMRIAARRIMTFVAPPISARHTVLALLATPSTTFATLLFRGYRLDEDRR